MNKGAILQMFKDIWNDIKAIINISKERLGYPTQKPVALLERIIKASSNEGDVVSDPFCGCATTLEAAHRLKRRWIRSDIAIHAIKRVARLRLQLLSVPDILEGRPDAPAAPRLQARCSFPSAPKSLQSHNLSFRS
ncbi:MAG: Modification methylase DpnIIB [Verrucomicrobia subdivision 3 bacterium]|nr:Modification methylase DpnIIB [Limisphaerales bacterium]MCS1414965.1 Modification methylase DpnIIB [Limisphaerales bacterium]